jgi:proline dehydrogenase
MSSGIIVKTGKALLNTALFLRFPVSWLVKPTIFKQFCGGETLKEAAKIINSLKKYNVKAVLDYSVEGDETDSGFDKALEETLKTVKFASSHKSDVPFAVFKPSAFGRRAILTKASSKVDLNGSELSELNNFKNRIDKICKTAFDLDVPVMIDAEHSYYQQIIDDVCEEMMEKYNSKKAIVFNTLQMYRTDRLEFLKHLLLKARKRSYCLGIKLVRGAYMEKERTRAFALNYPSPIHVDKNATDKDFDEALSYSIENIDKISIFCGTHNEKSSFLLTKLMEQKGIAKSDDRIWFSQLYGMSNHISFNLANEGFNVAKYIPYGPVRHVLPYLIRRTEENTSVKGQTSRELSLISMELERRKQLN